jgi:hypothetical protein
LKAPETPRCHWRFVFWQRQDRDTNVGWTFKRHFSFDEWHSLGVRKVGAPGETGELKGMKESDGERVANCTCPKPCVFVRKDEGEASVGVHAGWPLSCEIRTPRRKLRTLRGADTLEMTNHIHLPGSGLTSRP